MPRQVVMSEELRLGPRSVIRPGDLFRASGGPFWKDSQGKRLSMGHGGPFRFIRHCRRGAVVWVEAFDRNGAYCALNIGKKRAPLLPGYVDRPYKIKGKKRG